MWVTPDGVAHTVALPSPSELLTESALSAFKNLRKSLGNEELEELLEVEESAIFDDTLAPDTDDTFVGVSPPRAVLDGDLGTADLFVATVRAMDQRWRLDVVLALQDLIDLESPPHVRLAGRATRWFQSHGKGD
jgi:hypothetical protein